MSLTAQSEIRNIASNLFNKNEILFNFIMTNLHVKYLLMFLQTNKVYHHESLK